MRTLLFALAFLSTAAYAGNALQLPNLALSDSQATGTCGEARVQVSGVIQDDATGHTNVVTPEGEIRIIRGAKELAIGVGDLQDRNMVACVKTPKGPRLVVSILCSGRSCAPFDYWVIDPNKVVAIARPHDTDSCSLECAEEALGAKVPAPLTMLGGAEGDR